MSNRKGFTLIEMLVVIAIIGIIFSVTYPSLARSFDSSKENDRARQEVVINKALKQYYALTGEYPNYTSDPNTLSQELGNKTGVTLDTATYNYTYTADGKSEISSLHVDSK